MGCISSATYPISTIRAVIFHLPRLEKAKWPRHDGGVKFPERLRVLLATLFFAVLLAGCQHLPPNSLATHNSVGWEKEIAAFEASDRTNPPPRNGIIFYGSSSIRRWQTLQSDFPGLPVVNRGFGGSQLADAVNFADRAVIPFAPRQVVIYSGVNDIDAGKSPDVVFGDFVALVTRLRATLPHTRIALISAVTNPRRWSEVEQVKRFNSLAEHYCRKHGIAFIDVFPLMLLPDGHPNPELFVEDRLHMNAKGYAIWTRAVAPYLVK